MTADAAHNLRVHQCAHGNRAAAIHHALVEHVKPGAITITAAAALVGESRTSWSRSVSGGNATDAKVRDWLRSLREHGLEVRLVQTAGGVTATAIERAATASATAD